MSCILFLASYYGKVTLFEGHKVVKAKKTSPVSAFMNHDCNEKNSKLGAEPISNISSNNRNVDKEDTEVFRSINHNPEFEVIYQLDLRFLHLFSFT